jgi:hypothetical protein
MRSNRHIIQQLKDAYFGFIQSLEPPLAHLASAYDAFFPPLKRDHGRDEGQFIHPVDPGPLDILLPFMFAETFSLSPDDSFAIAFSGMFGFFSVLAYDDMFDQQILLDPDRLLLQNLLYTKALSYLHALFEQASPFWHYYRAYFGEYFRAISTERKLHCKLISAYDKAELYEIARGKSAPRKILLAAMAIRDGNDTSEKIETLSASLDACAIADQILDDITDWREDFSDRRFSYLLTRVIVSHGLEKRINVDARPSPVEIIEMAMHVFGSGEPQALLDEAHGLFEEAIRCVEGVECPEWKQFLRNRAETCMETKQRIEALVTAATRWFGDI